MARAMESGLSLPFALELALWVFWFASVLGLDAIALYLYKEETLYLEDRIFRRNLKVFLIGVEYKPKSFTLQIIWLMIVPYTRPSILWIKV